MKWEYTLTDLISLNNYLIIIYKFNYNIFIEGKYLYLI